MEYQIVVDTTGGAGVATGSFEVPNAVWGLAYSIVISYHVSAPATTDVVVFYTYSNEVEEEIVNVPNNATNIVVSPVIYETSAAGVSLGSTRPPLIQGGTVTVEVEGCDALSGAVDVSFQVL